MSIDFELRPPGLAEDVERLAKKTPVSDYTSVAARLEEDAWAAAAYVKKARKSMSKYDGPFDIKLKSIDEKSFTPGEKGTGRLTEVTVEGWRGFSVSRVETLVGRGKSSADFDGTEYDMTELTVADNRAVFTIRVGVAAEARTTDASSIIARKVAAECIERLT